MPRYWHEINGGTWTNVDEIADHFELKDNTDEDRLRALAASGDLEFVASPATATNGFTAINAAIAAAEDDKFTQQITFTLKTAGGEVHTWYSGTKTIGITDDSSGTASIADTATATTLKFVDGVGTVTVVYEGTWAAGEIVTLTLTDGNVLGVEPGDATFVDTLANDA
jgi:hypothetical protein